jgi:hypothetical protein
VSSVQEAAPAPDLATRLLDARGEYREAAAEVNRLKAEWEQAVLNGSVDVQAIEQQLTEAKVKLELVAGRVTLLEQASAAAKKAAAPKKSAGKPFVDPHTRTGNVLSGEIPAPVRLKLEAILDDIDYYEKADDQAASELERSIHQRLAELEVNRGGVKQIGGPAQGFPEPIRERKVKFFRGRAEYLAHGEQMAQRVEPGRRYAW